jgi:hypothetical protein
MNGLNMIVCLIPDSLVQPNLLFVGKAYPESLEKELTWKVLHLQALLGLKGLPVKSSSLLGPFCNYGINKVL